MHNIEFLELIESIKSKKISPIEITNYYLDRIEKYNGDLNAFVTITRDQAIKQAGIAEQQILKGEYLGPLHGMPYAAKDIIDTAGIRTTNGSKLYDDNYPSKDAFCIRKFNDCGAILLGKTNTHQYAAASTTINHFYGTTKNPHDLSRIAGGSSGGSASAVASDMAPIALGTDTGGSIRTPSSLCGIVGLKPTHGSISLSGVFPNTPSIDHVGPMCQSVMSAAIAYEALQGFDPADPKSRRHEKFNHVSITKNINNFRIALCPELYENQELDKSVQIYFDNTIEILRECGAQVEYISLEKVDEIQKLFYKIAGPEFTNVHKQQYLDNPDSFDPDVRKRMDWSIKIDIGDYLEAMDKKLLIHRKIESKLEKFDALMTPAVPFTAPPIKTLKAIINKKEYNYMDNIHRKFFGPFNITGMPSLVIPIGKDDNNLPIAIQIAGKKWCEHKILQIAYNIEKNIMYDKTVKF